MPENWIDLERHPATRSKVVRTIRARVNRSDAKLLITYCLEGDLGRIRVPSLSEAVIGRELWRHTCLEAFIMIEGVAAYHEFNFAPSREWTVYAFSGYRDGASLSDESMNPLIAVRSDASHLELDAVVQLDRLSTRHPDAALRLGLAAVIETRDGVSYWALRHPSDKPDFHNSDGFALTL